MAENNSNGTRCALKSSANTIASAREIVSATVFDGLTLRVHPNGTREYRGTRAEMLGAAIVTADQLPGEPECARKTIYRSRDAYDGSRVVVYRKRTYFLVMCWPSDHTRALLRSSEREISDVDKEMRLMPSSAEHYREYAIAFTRASLEAHLDSLSRAARYHGYQFDVGTLNAVRESFDDAIRCLLGGRVTLNRTLRDARLQELRARLARTDPGLQSFLHYAKAAARRSAAPKDAA